MYNNIEFSANECIFHKVFSMLSLNKKGYALRFGKHILLFYSAPLIRSITASLLTKLVVTAVSTN